MIPMDVGTLVDNRSVRMEAMIDEAGKTSVVWRVRRVLFVENAWDFFEMCSTIWFERSQDW